MQPASLLHPMLIWREGSSWVLAQIILLSLLDIFQSLTCMKIPHYLLLDIGSHLSVSPCVVIHVWQSYKGFLESRHMFGSPTIYKPIITSISNVTCESGDQNIFILAWRIFTFIYGSLSGWFIILYSMSMMSSLASSPSEPGTSILM